MRHRNAQRQSTRDRREGQHARALTAAALGPTSEPQVAGECQKGMKMLVKVFCDSGATTTSKLNLGHGKPRTSNRTASASESEGGAAAGETRSGAAGARGGAAALLAAALGAAALLVL